MDKNKPIDFKVGNARIAVWEHTRQDGGTFYSAQPSGRRYYHAESKEWRDGGFNRDGLEDLIRATELALAYIDEQQDPLQESTNESQAAA